MFFAALLFGTGLFAAEPKTEPSVLDEANCQLSIEGAFIEKLTLDFEGGSAKELTQPASSVSLPAGRYRVRQVELKGNYRYIVFAEKEDDWFQLTPSQPYHLKVGAPLKSKVNATRQGRLLKLDYELVDACGRNYSSGARTDPPTFAVFSGGREIGSGSFE